MKLKRFFRGNLFEFILIIFGVGLAVIGGYLIFNQNLVFGIILILFSLIVHFILSNRKQNKIIYGTSATPPPALDYPKGTIYIKHKK